MTLFIVRRLLYMVPMLLAFSLLAFGVMQLQPGDFLSRHALTMAEETRAQFRELYGLDQPVWVQYGKWVWGIVTRGDFGQSFETQQPAFAHLFLNGNRLGWSALLIGVTFFFTWLLAVPIGVFSAAYTHSSGGRGRSPLRWARRWGARLRSAAPLSWLAALGRELWGLARWLVVQFFNALALVGLSTPNFLVALLILWLLVAVFQVGQNFGLGISGLFDSRYVDAPWSWAKFWNFLWHLWPAVLVIGLVNLAQLIRHTRAHVLDVLGEPFIQTARAKGLRERVVLYKHAVRNALNPLVSLLGFWIPYLFEGMLVAAVVLQLPVVERAYWRALATEDQYVVMTGLLFFAFVLLLGNLLADVLLALVNPRIRYE